MRNFLFYSKNTRQYKKISILVIFIHYSIKCKAILFNSYIKYALILLTTIYIWNNKTINNINSKKKLNKIYLI